MSSTSPDPAADQAPQPDPSLDPAVPAAADAAPTEPSSPVAPEPAEPVATEPVGRVVDPARLRRAPRYGRFAVGGFLLGAVASLVLTLVTVSDDGLSSRNLFLLLLLTLGSTGIVLGLVTAQWVDRRSLRKRR